MVWMFPLCDNISRSLFYNESSQKLTMRFWNLYTLNRKLKIVWQLFFHLIHDRINPAIYGRLQILLIWKLWWGSPSLTIQTFPTDQNPIKDSSQKWKNFITEKNSITFKSIHRYSLPMSKHKNGAQPEAIFRNNIKIPLIFWYIWIKLSVEKIKHSQRNFLSQLLFI